MDADMDYYGLMPLFHRLWLPLVFLCPLGAQAQTPDSNTAAPVSSALDSELFYQLLLGELNARDGEPGTGYSLLLDAARKTNDGRIYQRAVDIALQSRSGESALAAARAWRQAVPASREANRYLLQILIGLNRIAETQEPLKREVASTDAKDRAAAISAIPRYFSRVSDKKLAAATVEQALTAYLGTPAPGVAAWTSIGRLRLDAADSAGAIEAARRGQALDAKAEGPAMLALSMMSPKTPQAEAIVKKYLEAAPSAEFRMDYARLLLDAQRYSEAAQQLQLVTLDKPDYLPAWLVRGALELQDGKLAAAEQSFSRYVDLALAKRGSTVRADSSRGLNQAYLSLAQIAEQGKDFAKADGWLKRIDNPEDLQSAQFRRASILARQGKLDEARKLIRSQPEKSAQDARMKISAEVQLLRDNKQYRSAYELLAEAVSRQPTDFDLVYDMAMMAEKLGKLDEMERLLRQVMAGKPDYQHAYNALGFSLAERNTRLGEARQLILKALEYAPADPFITDSLAWVEYRAGNLAEALRLLQGAFKAKPDAEIAAHLGEVLWTLGRRDEALSVWKEGSQINADNETLLDTLKRLRVKL
jgi:tetratricopeptide (TPR) repeat protein